MRCSCCDAELTDSEATAKYAEGSYRYIDMCTTCRGFLPKDIKIVSRPQPNKREEIEENDPYHLGDGENEWDDY